MNQKNVNRNTTNVLQNLDTRAYWLNYLNALMMLASLGETEVAQQKCLLNFQLWQHKNKMKAISGCGGNTKI